MEKALLLKKRKKINQIVVLHEIGTTYSSSQKCSFSGRSTLLGIYDDFFCFGLTHVLCQITPVA